MIRLLRVPWRCPSDSTHFRPGVRTLEMGLLMQGSTAEQFVGCLWMISSDIFLGKAARNSWIQMTILVIYVVYPKKAQMVLLIIISLWKMAISLGIYPIFRHTQRTILVIYMSCWRWPIRYRDCHGNRDQGSSDTSSFSFLGRFQSRHLLAILGIKAGWGGWSHRPSHFFPPDPATPGTTTLEVPL